MDILGAKGGKGGGGASRTPIESPDTLRSRSYAQIVDLLCEGEIEGLVTGDGKSIYLDQTPLLNSDGTANFTGVTLLTRNGTQGQTYMDGFNAVESEAAVGVKVTYSAPVIRTINSSVYDKVRVTISIPSLQVVDTGTGDTKGTSVQYKIEIQANGGSYIEYVNDTVTGKTTTKYQRSYVMPLVGSAPFNIRVTRLTPDSTRNTLSNETYFESFTEITDTKLSYPNSAVVGIKIDSQQFAQIPNRGYDVKMLKIKIPSNATVRPDGSLTYSGTWDGTFQVAWSSNPAWCFYDILTNTRYGLGTFINVDQVDKWALYTIGQYCDELVSDGFGGLEPRFTCNIYLQTQEEAYKVLQDMASIFRGMAFWADGQITAIQDRPSDPTALFNCANVVEGKFTYSGTSLKTRHSVATVQWNDPDDFYALNTEYVEDYNAVQRYGIVTTDAIATGCTSRGQAHRVGKWLLYSESNETETVTFSCSIEGTFVRPGDIINVQDAARAGKRLGGRIVAATTTTITLDSSPDAGTYTFMCMMPNGTVETKAITSIVGNVVTLASALSATPLINAVWMLNSASLALQTFRVITIVDAGDGIYEVTGVTHNSDKYNFIENDIQLTPRNISILDDKPATPVNLSISESLYEVAGGVKVLVTASWDLVPNADTYTVKWARDNGTNPTTVIVNNPILEIRDAEAGLYTIEVIAVTKSLRRSNSSTISKKVLGKTAPPANITNFSINVIEGNAHLSWDQSPDLDVRVGGLIKIRWQKETTGQAWSNAIDIGVALSGSSTSAVLPLLTGTYMIKAIDSSSNESRTAVMIKTDYPNIYNLNYVLEKIESPTFGGAKTNMIMYGSNLGLDGTILFDSVVGNFDDGIGDFDYGSNSGLAAYGIYEFAGYIDQGNIYRSRVKIDLSFTSFNITNLFDLGIGDFDSGLDLFDGLDISGVNVIPYISKTNDDPAGSPTWSAWQQFVVGDHNARAFKFKIEVIAPDSFTQIAINTLRVSVDVPDRIESGQDINIGSGGTTITFSRPFFIVPNIGVSIQNVVDVNDYYIISSRTVNGFTIQTKNGASGVARTIDWIAKGY